MTHMHRSRTERLISIGRVVLAGFALLAIWFDPEEPTRYPELTHALLAGYVTYAALAALLVPRIVSHLARFQVVTHVFDLVAFSSFMYVTGGSTGPFFAYFVFALIAATMRWQWRGTLWTALAALAAYLGMGIYRLEFFRDPSYGLNHLIMWSFYLGVVAWLLAFLGFHEARLRQEIGQLAYWSRDTTLPEGEDDWTRRMLGHAANTMGAPRVLLAWEDDDEPWLRLALWEGGEVRPLRVGPGEFVPLVAADLEGEAFLCSDVRDAKQASALYGLPGSLRRLRVHPVHRALAERFAMRSVVSLPVAADGARARLFFLDKPRVSPDDLTLGTIVAREVADYMADWNLRARLRESAAFEERVRLARDLHDGVLQSLTGTALQLETARRLLGRDVRAAEEAIGSVQSALAQEQRDLRLYVDTLKPGLDSQAPVGPDLAARLQELREGVARQWGIEVDVALEEQGALLTEMEGNLNDIYLMIREGLVNSARHAGATRAWAGIRYEGDHLQMVLGDDGRGFPFRGRLDAASLRARGAGPVTLMQRVEACGGTLTVDSSAAGSRIDITLPVDLVDTGLPMVS